MIPVTQQLKSIMASRDTASPTAPLLFSLPLETYKPKVQTKAASVPDKSMDTKDPELVEKIKELAGMNDHLYQLLVTQFIENHGK